MNMFEICLLLLLGATLLTMFFINYEQCSYCKAIALYSAVLNITPVDGLYSYGTEMYCVGTKGKTPMEIASIEEHEKCHALIHKDYEHFCNEDAKLMWELDYKGKWES